MEYKKKMKWYSILWVSMLVIGKVLIELCARIDPTTIHNGVVNPTHPVGICLFALVAFALLPILFTINRYAKLSKQRPMVILSYVMIGHHCLAVLGYAVNFFKALLGRQ